MRLSSLYRGFALSLVFILHLQMPHGRLQAQSTSPSSATATVQSTANDALLAKMAKLYYSTKREGLSGFDCSVHIDWQKLFQEANPGTSVSPNDSRVVLLSTVGVKLHARFNGNTKLEWNEPTGADAQQSQELMKNMHGAMDQVFTGFLQFWTPFVDGSTIPANTQGIEMSQGTDAIKINAKDGSTRVYEEFDNSFLLKHFDIYMDSGTTKFEPAYMNTDKGLLANYFVGHIQPTGATPAQFQTLIVKIDYQYVNGLPIPGKIDFQVVGSGSVQSTLSECSVLR